MVKANHAWSNSALLRKLTIDVHKVNWKKPHSFSFFFWGMLSLVVRSNTYFYRMWSQFVACPLPVTWWNLLFLFFLLQSQAKDEHLTFTERAMLLGIAVKWFSNSTDSQLQKTPAELKELQKNRWLFRIRAEIEKDYEVRGVMFPVATPCYYVACNQSYFAGNFIMFNNILTSLSRLFRLIKA